MVQINFIFLKFDEMLDMKKKNNWTLQDTVTTLT